MDYTFLYSLHMFLYEVLSSLHKVVYGIVKVELETRTVLCVHGIYIVSGKKSLRVKPGVTGSLSPCRLLEVHLKTPQLNVFL